VFLFPERNKITFCQYLVFLWCILCVKCARWLQAGWDILVCTQQMLIRLSCDFNNGPYQYNTAVSLCEAQKWSSSTSFIWSMILYHVQYILMLQKGCVLPDVLISWHFIIQILFFQWFPMSQVEMHSCHGCHQEFFWGGGCWMDNLLTNVCARHPRSFLLILLVYTGWKNRLLKKKIGIFGIDTSYISFFLQTSF
jgi:hypothetical protein